LPNIVQNNERRRIGDKLETKKLDILFIHTNASKKIYQDLAKNHSAIEPPIWAAMLANHCRLRGFGANILDCEAEWLDDEASANMINYLNPRVACFVVYGQQPSASTQNMQGAIGTANTLKNINSSIPIMFVGAHIAALPREVLRNEPSVDYICQNEGVYTISNFLSAIQSLNFDPSKIRGLGYRDQDGNPILNQTESIVAKNNLEHDLPGMAWDLLPDINKYRTAGWHSWSNNTEKAPFAALYTSLGCPYRCSFCMINIINRTDSSPNIASSDSNIFRYWNPEFIIKQFDKFAEMGVKNVKIADELFVLNPRHFMKICELLIERDYDFNIWAYSRIDTCKPEYLDTLKRAGVNWLGLGIENPNQTLRQEIHKDRFKEVRITDIINEIRASGINVAANYIFGLPMDTEESMQETLDFAIENMAEMVNFYCAMAYPGSPLHLMARNKGWELPTTYSGYSQHSYDTLNLANDNLQAKQILRFRDNAWMKYHTSEKYLNFLESKFGAKAKVNVENTSKIKLKRKLLEEQGEKNGSR
jgi:anaerobic magnesium-protoporphyrin IX monomethyl ester cyclase